MKLLVIAHDEEGHGLDLCLRAVAAGHAVRYWMPPLANQAIGAGFKGMERISHWPASAKWADLIWCTGNDAYLPRLEFFGKSTPYFGPSPASAKLELDRKAGMKWLAAHGIQAPAHKAFKTLADAEAYQRKSSERHVFRADDRCYVSHSPADMVAYLQRQQEGPCELQEFIDGIACTVAAWMGTGGWIGMPSESFEVNDGVVAKYCNASPLFDEVLAPLGEALQALGHRGAVGVECIIDAKGEAWPLELMMRPDWPLMAVLMACHKGDPIQWMQDACKGDDTLEASTAIACGVELEADEEGLPMYGITPKVRKYLAPLAVTMATQPDMEGGEIVKRRLMTTAGECAAVALGTGRSVRQAAQRACDVANAMYIPWREACGPIGGHLEAIIPELQTLGYASEFVFK